MSVSYPPRARGGLLQTRVEKFDDGGVCLTSSSGQRVFLPWSLLGLTQAPNGNGGSDQRVLRWRLHCVDPGSGTKEFFSGDSNRWVLRAQKDRAIFPQTLDLRTGVLEVELQLERRAMLGLVASMPRVLPMRLTLAEPLSICLEHRQPWDKGACCLCSRGLVRCLRESSPREQFQSAEAYAARWGAMIELEAAASAIESNDSRFLCNVAIRWEPRQPGGKPRGSFDVPVSLIRAHKLKFRGLLAQGGETASSWLCMRDSDMQGWSGYVPWSGHARVVAAGVIGEGEQLGLDEEDNLKSMDGRRSITVVFEVLPEVSDPRPPTGEYFFVEYVQKALSSSMQHTALAEVNPAPAADGSEPKPLLARDVVLNRLPRTAAIDAADISRWNLNESQDQAVRRALARPLMLVHGPPGTGKTRTAAILMTLLAQRNLGARCAILFAAPTNKACDSALYSTNKLCQGHFAERLRARVEDDGEDNCAICLAEAPDIVTACGHVFHRECVARCLQESSKCPICRQVLKQHGGGLRVLRVFGADSEREDFPVPRRIDHKGIQSFKAQRVPPEMRRFTLHWRCHAAVEGEEPSAEALQTRAAYDRLLATNVKSGQFDEVRMEYYDALEKARAVEVHQSDIIFTTCVSARRLALVAALEAEGAPEVRQVVLDEAGQAPEPEALCPLAVARHAKQAILFGDHKQLRPILRSRIAEDAGLGVSLFERLATWDWGGDGEAPVSLLAQQYRMHPAISCFPCVRFYDGKILDDSSVLSRPPGLLAHPGTNKQSALLLWDGAGQYSGGQEQLQQVRTVAAGGVGSRCNIEEAHRAAALASELARQAGTKSVAVLSWYNSQVAKVSELMRRSGFGGVHVGSIATAQGSEWDYVILSAVRSDSGGGSLGLVADPHNLNVALTRAKLGLVVLCDSNAVRYDAHWSALLGQCSGQGLLVRERPIVRAAPRQRASAPVIPPPPPAPPAFTILTPESSSPGTRRHGRGTWTPGDGSAAQRQRPNFGAVDSHRQIAAMLQSQLCHLGCGRLSGSSPDGVCSGCSGRGPSPFFPAAAPECCDPPAVQPPMPSDLPSTALFAGLPAREPLVDGLAPSALEADRACSSVAPSSTGEASPSYASPSYSAHERVWQGDPGDGRAVPRLSPAGRSSRGTPQSAASGHSQRGAEALGDQTPAAGLLAHSSFGQELATGATARTSSQSDFGYSGDDASRCHYFSSADGPAAIPGWAWAPEQPQPAEGWAAGAPAGFQAEGSYAAGGGPPAEGERQSWVSEGKLRQRGIRNAPLLSTPGPTRVWTSASCKDDRLPGG